MPQVVRPNLPPERVIGPGCFLRRHSAYWGHVFDPENHIAVVEVYRHAEDAWEQYEASYDRTSWGRCIWIFPEGINLGERDHGIAYLEEACPR